MSDISASQLYSLLQTQIPRQNSTPIPAEIVTIRDDNVVLNTPRGEVEIPRQTLPPHSRHCSRATQSFYAMMNDP